MGQGTHHLQKQLVLFLKISLDDSYLHRSKVWWAITFVCFLIADIPSDMRWQLAYPMICSTSSIESIEHGLPHLSYLVLLLDKSWRRKWKLTPVFLPEISQGQRNLEGFSPWGCKVSETTLQLNTHTHRINPWGSKELDMTDHTCMHTIWTLCPKLTKTPQMSGFIFLKLLFHQIDKLLP